MKYRYHCFCSYKEDVVRNLDEHEIEYKLLFGLDKAKPKTIVLDVWSTDADIEAKLQMLNQCGMTVLTYVEYSQAELDDAKYLVVRPKKQAIDCGDDAFRYNCQWEIPFSGSFLTKAMHQEQIGVVTIRTEPSTKGRTAFWAESTGYSLMFADYRIRDLAHQYELKGILFEPVFLKNKRVSERLFQMKAQTIIGHEAIEFGYGEKVLHCRFCGKPQYIIDRLYQLHLDDAKLEQCNDLLVTECIFGEGIAHPLYVISQKFYQLLKENKLTSGLSFEPVVMT